MSVAEPVILLATVAIEPNRWTKEKRPSILVSEWLQRAKNDGFDGVELWENHVFGAAPEERRRLRDFTQGLRVFLNCYTTFSKDEDNAVGHSPASVAEAAADLAARGVKFNVGDRASETRRYYANVAQWLSVLPDSTVPLCECHPGTILEKPADASAFFSSPEMDSVRFIVHPAKTAPGELEDWIGTGRIAHAHIQSRAMPLEENSAAIARIRRLHSAVPEISYSIEFTSLTQAPDETPERSYAAAVRDALALRRIVRDL